MWVNSELVADRQVIQAMTAKVRGVSASLLFSVDVLEHASRQSRGAGAFVSVGQLLAAFEETDFDSPPARGQLWLSGFAEDQDRCVPSIAPPVTVCGARINAGSWGAGLSRASKFAGYTERTVVLRTEPRESSAALLEASFYGVGLVVGEGVNETILAAPAPFEPERFSLASWLFAEQVYREWLLSQ
ncbi:hypothetical protein FB472_0045 [Rhodoglobus vestalii]|uniref:Uncharacterized protein n=1 Tax=Rhodoglobus vestalii TaxID=193384 RepID=A0A8H2K4F5_9MICO|nr:hypothetical protein FB472_0045 [Rhodoglobus vestalii]